MDFRVLAVGDVCGGPGLEFLRRRLRTLKKAHNVDFCVVNGENAAIVGITPKQADAILEAGADVITLGNHSFQRKEIAARLDEDPYLLRPANESPLFPGRGVGVYETRFGDVAVLNLLGRCSMDFRPNNPFLAVDALLKPLNTRLILVDFHAEASSEKRAMGFYLDGKVSAVWGTHTHVPTADDEILPQGTGYVSDLGMTGPRRSVLGVKPEQSIIHFRGGMNTRFESADGPCKLEAVLFAIDPATGKTLRTERIVDAE